MHGRAAGAHVIGATTGTSTATQKNPMAGNRCAGRSAEYLILAAILVLGAALRLWGAFFDLPYIFHPDEPINLVVIQTMLSNSDPNPHYFDYPSLVYYLDASAGWLYYHATAFLSGTPWKAVAPLSVAMGSTYTPAADVVALYRSLTICSGVLSVFLIYLIGKRGHSVRAGLVGAMLMAISPMLVADCRHITPDSYVIVFELLTILASLSIAASGRWMVYAMAGAAVGATAAAKYNGALVCLCVAAAHLLRFGFAPRKWGRPGLAAATSALVFLLCSPFALLDHHSFLAGMMRQFHHYSEGHQGMEGNAPVWYLQQLWAGTGVAAILALVQIARLRRHRSALSVVLAGFAIPYLLFIGMFAVRNERTLLPVVPCVLLLAATFVVDLGSARLQLRNVSPTLRMALLSILGLALTLSPLRITLAQATQLTTVDSRTTAREWIDSHLPPQSVIAIESYAPFVDPSRFRIVQSEHAIDHSPDWYLEHNVDYLVLSQGMFGRYFGNPQLYPEEVALYRRLAGSLTLAKRFTDGGYEVLVYRTRAAAVPAPTQ
jgi:4-amino-4-deoxy-L-arabinose transferase-like glycosyltransferase